MKKSKHVQCSIQYHIAWATKYRYKVLVGRVANRTREIIRYSCAALGVEIIKGSIGSDHVYLFVSCPPNISVSKLVQVLKGRTSKVIQSEYKEIEKRYWKDHLWASGYFCQSVGFIDKNAVHKYIDRI